MIYKRFGEKPVTIKIKTSEIEYEFNDERITNKQAEYGHEKYKLAWKDVINFTKESLDKCEQATIKIKQSAWEIK